MPKRRVHSREDDARRRAEQSIADVKDVDAFNSATQLQNSAVDYVLYQVPTVDRGGCM